MRNWLLVGVAAAAISAAGYVLLWPRSPKEGTNHDQSTPEETAPDNSAAEGDDPSAPREAEPAMPSAGTGHGLRGPYAGPGNAELSGAPQPDAGPSVYESSDYGLTVRKPGGPGWMMTTDRERFFIQEPGKVVEMHHNAGTGRRPFGTIYIYVLPAPGSGDGGRELGELERLDKKASRPEFRVEEEGPVRVGAQDMVRRVTLWSARGRETKFLSVRCRKGSKFYVLLAFASPADFDALLPDFEAAIDSLDVR